MGALISLRVVLSVQDVTGCPITKVDISNSYYHAIFIIKITLANATRFNIFDYEVILIFIYYGTFKF